MSKTLPTVCFWRKSKLALASDIVVIDRVARAASAIYLRTWKFRSGSCIIACFMLLQVFSALARTELLLFIVNIIHSTSDSPVNILPEYAITFQQKH
jgi:hypothetical protein